MLAAARAAILACAAAAAPEEGCGVLVGRVAGSSTLIIAAPPLANTAATPRDRFAIAPSDLAAAAAAARRQGLEIVGFYHSHPRGLARPSAADVAEASAWPGYAHVIAATQDPARLRGWETGLAGWTEQPLLDGGLSWPTF